MHHSKANAQMLLMLSEDLIPGGKRMLELDFATLVFQIINFVVLLVGLNFLVFRPLRNKLNERGRELSETLQSARDQEAEAALTRAQWEERMHAVEQQAEQILDAAKREAESQVAELFEEARQRMDRMTDLMRQDIARQRDEILARHYDELLEAIIELSGNVIRSVTTRRTHDDLVSNFCASAYQLPQTEIDEYRRIMAGRMPAAFVATPVALTPEQNKTLTDTLSALIDRRVELHIQIRPELVAGVQVRLADRIMDNSVRQQLERVREQARHDLVARLGATVQDV